MSRFWKHELREARDRAAFDATDFSAMNFTVTTVSFDGSDEVVETMSMADAFASLGSSPMSESAEVRTRMWDWFAEALAYTLFTLPPDSRLIFANLVDGETDRFVRFTRFDEFLLCETSTTYDSEQRNPKKRRGSVDMWSYGEWQEPDPKKGMDSWFRIIGWPGAYAEFEEVADAAVEAFRYVSSAEWPQELVSIAVDVKTDAELEIPLFEHDPVDAETMTSFPAERLEELLAIHEEMLDHQRSEGARAHRLRVGIAGSYARNQHAEVLVIGAEDDWPPTRERTLDVIAQTGPTSLLVMDVVLDVPAGEDVGAYLALREFDEVDTHQGSRPYLDGMLAADPDFAEVLRARPALAEAVRAGTVQLQYHLMVVCDDGSFSACSYL
ncbi:hypothetical protein [Nocardia sp. NPDC056000]|uniref:TY-Chap domain-containing protein n=1 Tax=Nocardia sp. NPDC056000 TaxID=3345674 RepID=UPI0035D71E6A